MTRRPVAASRFAPLVASALLALCLAAPATHGAATSEAKLARSLVRASTENPDARFVVWVRFTDRSGAERDPSAYAKVRATWPSRSFDRRSRRGSLLGVQASDLPVDAGYVRALAVRGARVRGVSRWLNAASAEMSASDALEIAKLPFVARIEPVGKGTRRERDLIVGGPSDEPELAIGGLPMPGDTAFYGGAFKQLSLMQVPQLHAAGISGAEVLVCVLDTGFKLDHPIFTNIDVVATRDFVNGDLDVGPDSTQDLPTQPQHGTWVLGTLAGHLPGTYVGGAYGASYALAKTENLMSETPVEMDLWQFGAEWADSLGADVLSSSLGYTLFDDEEDSYTYADMDGRTTTVTLAALEAVQRGITVLTAVGNEGASPWHYLIAPSDADTVIAVGAVDSFNVVATFSSRGPSADQRIKPDVTTMGVQVLTGAYSTNGYSRVSGTSFATPLASAVAALLLDAHPTWGPFEVREAMRNTALNSATPDTIIGWGLVQGMLAKDWSPTTDAPAPELPSGLSLSVGPNPLRLGVHAVIHLGAPGPGRATIDVLDLAGRRVAYLFDGSTSGELRLLWNGTGADGQVLAAGIYWVRAVGASRTEAASVRLVLLP